MPALRGNNMKTLYEQNPKIWERFANAGKPSICEMSKHFTKCSDMDRALGMENTAAKWARGKNLGSNPSEMRAKEWLDAQSFVSPATPDQSATFLCICDKATAAKVQKVLALMGCEFVEV
jgi:hypothetical protein